MGHKLGNDKLANKKKMVLCVDRFMSRGANDTEWEFVERNFDPLRLRSFSYRVYNKRDRKRMYDAPK